MRIDQIKQFARERLPQHSVLRDVILFEPDDLQPVEFIAKVDVWLRLIVKEATA
jgi:hypothetical protein